MMHKCFGWVWLVALVGICGVGRCAGWVGPGPLHVDPSGRYLADSANKPFFMLADTAWDIARYLKRDESTEYLKHRRAQAFNTIALVAFNPGQFQNIYDSAPFKLSNGRMDPASPLVTPGADPADPRQYDYWDHLDFIIDEAGRNGLYAIVLPCWGDAVVGSYAGKPSQNTLFRTPESAWAYGRWIGERYKARRHVIWMLGGDCAGAYPEHDYRAIFRAMAEGIADGVHGGGKFDGQADYSGLLMSFHPQKPNPQSSAWFHGDPWLSFNSIQAWPDDQIKAVSGDHALTPARPTWIFEGRYEGYYKGGYKPEQWGEWQTRQQAWQSVLSGGFGFTYGHERIFDFGHEGNWDWKKELDAPGARCMTHLVRFLSVFGEHNPLAGVPDQGLVAGNAGKAERLKSDRITALRDAAGSLAIFYSASGRAVQVNESRLTKRPFHVYWFNPASGKWAAGGQEHEEAVPFASGVSLGADGAAKEFNPPVAGHDWVLVLNAGERL